MDKREDLKQKEGKKKEVYLTTRLLESLAKKAFKEAAKETMRVMGYNVIAQDGWVVKKFADGRIVKLHELEEVSLVGNYYGIKKIQEIEVWRQE